MIILWELILAKLVFKGTHNIRVSILDIYLGTRLFDQNYDMALNEVLNCSSNPGKKMLFQFHELDFLLVVKIYNHYLEHINKHMFQIKAHNVLILVGQNNEKPKSSIPSQQKKDSGIANGNEGGDVKDQNCQKLERIWKDTNTPNMTPYVEIEIYQKYQINYV